MRQPGSVAIAIWMLERLTGRRDGALGGDLLEELAAGRTVAWLWRQTLLAIGADLVSQSRRYVWPVAFSGGWCLLYPVWQRAMEGDAPLQRELARWSALDWPYSALASVGGAFFPAASFVWLGLLVYVATRGRRWTRPSLLRVVLGLSLSVNVLFVTTVTMMGWSGQAAHAGGQEIFHATVYPTAWGVPLFLSLFCAVLAAIPKWPSRHGAASTSA